VIEGSASKSSKHKGDNNMSTKKIFYKKDMKDIILFLKEEGEATLNDNYKNCSLTLIAHGSTFELKIKDSLNCEYSETFPKADNYDDLYKYVSEHFSEWEKEYIQGEAKTLEEVMKDKAENAKAEKEQEEIKNFDLLNEYIKIGNEAYYCDCLTYYNDKKNLSAALNKLIHNEIEQYSCSQFRTAFYLKTVYDMKLYEELGFKNIYDYASDEFGIARGTVSNWLMVASNFGVLNSDTGFYSLDERLKDFSITQLVLVRQLTIEQIEELGIVPGMTTRQLKTLIKEKLNINAIATSVKPDTDTSSLPDNPDDEEELYKEAEALDGSMNEPEESEGSEEEQPTEKVKLRLMFTGGSELSDTQIVFLNKFLTSQPKNKKLKLVFIEEN
jgi:hypothetical protein